MQPSSMVSIAVSGAAATTTPTLIPPNDLLVIGTDYGTGTTRTMAQHIHGIYTRQSAKIRTIQVRPDQTAAISQVMILPPKGKVIYGSVDVLKAVERDPSLEKIVIRRPKLGLHPEFRHVPDVVHMLQTIFAEKDRAATQDLFEAWLRALINDVRAAFKRPGYNNGQPDSYWDAIPLEVLISVPAMWHDEPRGIIRNAAQRAALASGSSYKDPRIDLLEEALCVATYFLTQDDSAKVGSFHTFVDVGDGTLDISTVEVTRAHLEEAPMQLRRVGICSGNGAGSSMVNAAALTWVREKYGQELDRKLIQLRITWTEFSRQLWDQVEALKPVVDTPRKGSARAVINSSHGLLKPGLLIDWTIPLPDEAIMQWYDTWMTAADQLLVDHLRTSSTERPMSNMSAKLTGGGSNSTRFVECMKKRFAERNIDCTATTEPMACAKGALLQDSYPKDKLLALANYYVTTKVHLGDIRMAAEEEQKELEQEGGGTFDPSNKREPRKSKKDRSGAKPCSKRPRSEDDEDLKEDKKDIYLPHRTNIIGRYRHGVFTREKPILMGFPVDADGKHLGRIHVDLFWSKVYFKDHTPLKDNAGNLIPGVRALPLCFADLDDLKAKGFEAHGGDDNTNTPPHFELKAFVEMPGTSEKLVLTLHVMKPDFEFPRERDGAYVSVNKEDRLFEHLDGAYATVNKDDRLFEHTQEVWSKGCSHFTSNTTGTSSSSGEDPAEAVPPMREVRQRRCKR